MPVEQHVSLTYVTMLAGHAEEAEVTWRSLYACSNGWRGLRPGSFEMMGLPCSSNTSRGYPAHCMLDGRELGWTAAAGGASELLVADTYKTMQVTARSTLFHAPALWTAHSSLTIISRDR